MKTWMIATSILTVALLAPSVAPADDRPAAQTKLDKETVEAIELFKKADPEMARLFKEAAGYAVFPGVSKGAAGIGAAHGQGQVYTEGRLIGTATLTQVTIGLQLGGQEFAEVIFFETKETLDAFAAGKFAMSAQVTAIAAVDGASSTANYQHGVQVYTVAKGGLMFEASVGGQKFRFTPLRKVPLY